MKKFIFALIILTLLLAACGNGESGGGDPAKAVEMYMQAKITSDEATIRSLLCSEMEQDVDREIMSFSSVSDAKIEGMSCTDTGNGRVACEGTIVALYGTEETEFQLATYRAVQEDGEWKWCGETQ